MTARPRPRVLVALRPDGTRPPGLTDAAGDLADFVFVSTADEVLASHNDVPAAFVWNFRSTLIPQAIGRLPRLEWVHVAASGVDASLSDEVRSRRVIVTNSRGVTAEAMAEYALALMLAVAKSLPVTFADQRQRQWTPRLSRMLAGRCLVTVGVGPVGRSLAAKATALGMRVIGIGRRPHPPGGGFERIDGADRIREAFAEADYVVAATPLTSETRGLIGRAELAALSRDAVLVNLGRGAVIDEPALVEALVEERLGAACLDVFQQEPLPTSSPLWELPQVIVSPHMSSDFTGWEEAMVDLFVANLRRWREGTPLTNVVDLSLGYVAEAEPALPAPP